MDDIDKKERKKDLCTCMIIHRLSRHGMLLPVDFTLVHCVTKNKYVKFLT